VHGSWREVSDKENILLKTLHRMRKIYSLLIYNIDTLSLSNPDMDVYATFVLFLNSLFQLFNLSN
jgi:hypothetical protein